MPIISAPSRLPSCQVSSEGARKETPVWLKSKTSRRMMPQSTNRLMLKTARSCLQEGSETLSMRQISPSRTLCNHYCQAPEDTEARGGCASGSGAVLPSQAAHACQRGPACDKLKCRRSALIHRPIHRVGETAEHNVDQTSNDYDDRAELQRTVSHLIQSEHDVPQRAYQGAPAKECWPPEE
jgi:hypothetical protein